MQLDLDFGSIKNVGTVPVDSIVKERQEHGNYESFTEFCERIADEAVNKKCIESLIKAGAFDEFKQTRSTLLASFEGIIDTIQSSKKKGFQGQVTMFDLGTEEKENLDEMKYTFEEHEELPDKELLALEKEMLGIYISGHPLEKLREQIEKQTNINTIELRTLGEQMSSTNTGGVEGELGQVSIKYHDGQNVKYAGIINSVKKKYTKNNKIMAFVSIEDLYGTAEVIVFENAYIKAGKSLIHWKLVTDNSLNGNDTFELVSPILEGEGGLEKLETYFLSSKSQSAVFKDFFCICR